MTTQERIELMQKKEKALKEYKLVRGVATKVRTKKGEDKARKKIKKEGRYSLWD
jgi:hypothetical protein